MKPSIVALLMILVVSLSFRAVVTCLCFYWNQAQIAEKHCVNKARPQLRCDGKCYLKKVLDQQQSDEQSPNKGADKEALPFYGLPVSTLLATNEESLQPTIATRLTLAFLPTPYSFLYQNVAIPPPKPAMEQQTHFC